MPGSALRSGLEISPLPRKAVPAARLGNARAKPTRSLGMGETPLPMLSLGGVLKFKPEEGRGLSVAKLRAGRVHRAPATGRGAFALDTRRHVAR